MKSLTKNPTPNEWEWQNFFFHPSVYWHYLLHLPLGLMFPSLPRRKCDTLMIVTASISDHIITIVTVTIITAAHLH